MLSRTYWVYIVASHSRVLYIGVTNDLVRRVDAHRRGTMPGFTRRYRVTRLVYFEQTNDIWAALRREKQLKGWRRSRKLDLVATMNADWLDLWDSAQVLTRQGVSS